MKRAVLLVLASALLAGCGTGGDERPRLADGPRDAPATSAPATTTTLAPFTFKIAEARVPLVSVFDAPEAPAASQTFEHPWHVNDDPSEPTVPLVFLVEEERDDWVRVLLPVRPNGTTGWVRESDVNLTVTPYHVTVSLSAHRITVFEREQAILDEPVAIGKPATPTPPGRYYIRVLLANPNPGGVYGPFAYGLSAHSDVLTSFNGGDGEVGIHGNNDASVLGQSVSSGCVRMSNDGITRLTEILPLGAPVEIVQ